MLASSDGGTLVQFLLIGVFILFGLIGRSNKSRRGKTSTLARPPRPVPRPTRSAGAPARQRTYRVQSGVEGRGVDLDRMSPGDANENPAWLAGINEKPVDLEDETPAQAAAEAAAEPPPEAPAVVSEGPPARLDVADARRAIVLSEILGPPVSLRR
ncbi:MAG TPA: hypothetical protein VJ992_05980 [Gemmatimonadales bacterium]|nr:hypothetical protein [Gemmatimonadales bacterium]